MLITTLTLLAILYLPGAIIFRLPVANRPKRAALPAEERLFWAVIISAIVTTTVAFVLAALSAYTVGRVAAVNTVLAVVAVLAARGNLKLERHQAVQGMRGDVSGVLQRWSTAAIPALLVALATWMYFAVPPAEWVVGGRDPGVYVNEGIQIAQRGSLMTTDALVAAVPPEARDLFFPAHDSDSFYSMRFMGFHLRNPEAGTVSGQFPQGYPIWIAIAYGFDGLSGARRVISWWAILGVLATYFSARRLVGPIAAAAAAGLLAVHVIQTWYARYPNSEMMTQALLFAALLAHAYAHEDEDGFFGPVSASLLGLALFTRLPVIVAVGAAVAASLLASVNGHRPRAGFLVTLGGWLAATAVYYTTQLRPYFSRPITYMQSLQTVHLVLLVAAMLAMAGLLWAVRTPRIAMLVRLWLPRLLIAMVSIGAIYGLLFRGPGAGLAPHDALALRVFADLYFTRIALILAVIGYALVVWRSFWRAPAMILTVTVLAFFFFYKMRIWPENFWLARRFLTEILPGALIFAAAAMFAPLWLTRSRPAFAAIGVLAALFVGQQYLSASQPIRTHIEYAGIIPRLEQLAGRFSDDDLVIVEARAASDVHVLALPLSYIYARNVLVLYDSRPDKASVRKFLTWAHEKYGDVYFIAGGGTDLLSPGVRSLVVSTERYQVPEYEQTTYAVYPRRSVMKPFDFTIYRLVELGSAVAPQSLDIGGTDDLNLVDFHPKERLAGGDLTFRWSQDASYLVMRVQPESRQLALTLSGGRPRGVAPAHVTVYLDDEPLGTADPANEFREYVFPIPEPLASRTASADGAQIRIQSTTWVPRTTIGGPDTRALGVMLDRAEIR